MKRTLVLAITLWLLLAFAVQAGTIYLPIVMRNADPSAPFLTPTPKAHNDPGSPLAFESHNWYRHQGEFVCYTNLHFLDNLEYPWPIWGMTIIGFKLFDNEGVLLYENWDEHPCDLVGLPYPDHLLYPGDQTRIVIRVPSGDVPIGVKGVWFAIRWQG